MVNHKLNWNSAHSAPARSECSGLSLPSLTPSASFTTTRGATWLLYSVRTCFHGQWGKAFQFPRKAFPLLRLPLRPLALDINFFLVRVVMRATWGKDRFSRAGSGDILHSRVQYTSPWPSQSSPSIVIVVIVVIDGPPRSWS